MFSLNLDYLSRNTTSSSTDRTVKVLTSKGLGVPRENKDGKVLPTLNFADNALCDSEIGLLYAGNYTAEQLAQGFVVINESGGLVLSCWGENARLAVQDAIAKRVPLTKWATQQTQLALTKLGAPQAMDADMSDNNFRLADPEVVKHHATSEYTRVFALVQPPVAGSGFSFYTPWLKLHRGWLATVEGRKTNELVDAYVESLASVKGGDRLQDEVRALGRRYAECFPYLLSQHNRFIINNFEFRPVSGSQFVWVDLFDLPILGDFVGFSPFGFPIPIIGSKNNPTPYTETVVQEMYLNGYSRTNLVDYDTKSSVQSSADALRWLGFPTGVTKTGRGVMTDEDFSATHWFSKVVISDSEAPDPSLYMQQGAPLTDDAAEAVIAKLGSVNYYSNYPFFHGTNGIGLGGLTHWLFAASNRFKAGWSAADRLYTGFVYQGGRISDAAAQQLEGYIRAGGTKPKTGMLSYGARLEF